MSLTLVWPKSLRNQRFSATLTPVKSFGDVVRAVRTANGLSQKEVADAGGLDQSRVSEIERGRYLPGLDMAMRLANGLGVTLTEIVGQWEGARGAAQPGGIPQRVSRRRMPAAPLDVPQEDVFRRVRGLWELMSPERREAYWKQGKALVAAQWKEETRGEFPRAAEPTAKPRRRSGSRTD
jgi:transcriptional regulator with XRE-family HTH domain